MNKLTDARRVAIVKALVEGNSMRATARLTGASLNTVVKLLVDMGELCALFHDAKVRQVPAKRVQCDEIWSFVGAKAKQVKAGANGAGDVWTWTAMDSDSKLMVSWLVGRRDPATAAVFMDDLAGRLANRVQLTTDGLRTYLDAVEYAFGSDVDYAQLVKLYGESMEGNSGRYSPAMCTGAIKTLVSGNPEES